MICDLRYFVFFNNISVVLGQWEGDTEELYGMVEKCVSARF